MVEVGLYPGALSRTYVNGDGVPPPSLAQLRQGTATRAAEAMPTVWTLFSFTSAGVLFVALLIVRFLAWLVKARRR